MKIRTRLNLALPALILLFITLAASKTEAQIINDILKRIESHRNSLTSVRSKVSMTTTVPQLETSDTFEGAAIYSRLARTQIRLKVEWTRPVQESLSFINGQYIIFRPRLKQAIVGRTDRESVQVNNALSFLYMSRKEIRANYTFMYTGNEKVGSGVLTWQAAAKTVESEKKALRL